MNIFESHSKEDSQHQDSQGGKKDYQVHEENAPSSMWCMPYFLIVNGMVDRVPVPENGSVTETFYKDSFFLL